VHFTGVYPVRANSTKRKAQISLGQVSGWCQPWQTTGS
jgi:hypothetical protein